MYAVTLRLLGVFVRAGCRLGQKTNSGVAGQSKVVLRWLCIVSFLSSLHSPLFAQQDIEEVVVEAEQSDNAVLDDLASVTAIDGEKLADAGIENVEDVAQYVPNLTLTQTETGTNISIRGIGAGVNQGFDQSVGLFSDGVPLPRSNMARSPFLDLAGVQVKRGPQYVLDGNYAIAGSVHLISNLATDEFKAGFDFNYVPSQNDRTLQFVLGGPVTDKLSANLVFQQKVADGYIENQFKSRDEAQKDEEVVRLVLGYEPTESLSFKLKAEAGHFDSDGRAAEIILDQPTPDPSIQAINKSGTPIRRDARLQAAPAAAWVTEADKILTALDINYDNEVNLLLPQYSVLQNSPDARIYAFAGKSYTGAFSSIYAENGVAPPPGLSDTAANFERSTDGTEFSNNDSLNLTLASSYALGEHKFTLTNSYIEYDVDESIDADFTPVPILIFLQQETYEQQFNSFVYESPRDRFLEVDAGLWYMTSDLRYTQRFDLQYSDRQQFFQIPQNAEPGETDPENLANIALWQELGGFYSDPNQLTEPDPLRAYLASASGGGATVLGTSTLAADRIFEQDQQLRAAFINAKLNLSENFRATLGLRYTYSKKSAVRDVAFVREDGSVPTAEQVETDDDTRAIFVAALNANAGLFGLQLHTCRSGINFNVDFNGEGDFCISGTRVEENLLPSIAFEYDVRSDLTLLASARLASKLGGFDARANSRPDVLPGTGAPVGTFEFEDEEATVFELGARWFGPGGSVLNGTAFYTDYTNLQLSRSDGRSGSLVDNAGAARNTGVELDGLLQITDQFTINYSAAYIDFEFEEFEFGSCHLGRRPDYFLVDVSTANTSQSLEPFADRNIATNPNYTVAGGFLEQGLLPIIYDAYRPQQGDGPSGQENTLLPNRDPGTFPGSLIAAGVPYDNPGGVDTFENRSRLPAFCDFAGQTNQFVARWQGSFSFNFQHDLPRNIRLSQTLDVIYNSGYHTAASQDPLVYQDEFVLFNGRLELASAEDIWTVALVGENLTNKKVVTYSQQTPIASGFQGARGFFGFLRPPRSVGVNVRYAFY